MSHLTRLACSTALATALMPQLALADVTADDVWQNTQDYIATFGAELSTTVDRQGDTLLIGETKLAFQLPLDLGTVAFAMPGFSMRENGDGTVAITYSNPAIYGISADIKDKGSFSGNIVFATTRMETIASGVPGDVTYNYAADRLDFSLSDIEIDLSKSADEAQETPEITGKGSFVDLTGTTRITVGELVTVQSSYSYGNQDIRFNGEADQVRFAYLAEADSFSGSTQATLPRNGMDVMNLAAALRDGLAITGSSKTIGYRTSQSTEENGVMASSQSTSVQEQSAQFGLDQAGLRGTGTALRVKIDAQPDKDLPFPLKFEIDKAEGAIALPMSAASGLQDVIYNFVLEDLTMDEEIWALFDPGQTLPRDPMTVALELSAKIKNKLNWLDFMVVQAGLEGDDVPIELHEVTLNMLVVDMVGAKLSATGSGTFDNSDMESFGGFPRPVGVVDLSLIGGNGLLDNLVAIGLMSDEDATGARLGVAVVTKPDPDAGEDALKSRLEMNEQGHLLANGQRLR